MSAHSVPPLPVLTGRLVQLRPFSAADITPAYIGWLNDPETVRFSNQRFVQHTRESCERYYASFAGGANHFLSIRLRADHSAVGTLTAYRSLPHGTVDIGILVGDRRVWGQGIGLDAFKTLADWWSAQPGVRKVTAGTLKLNTGMVRVAERAGLHLEAVRRGQELVDGQAVDMLYFARFTSPIA
ncbi:MAG: GNAT family N-acetyltransferase [Rubrivivax sp.]|jgi:RimJ/RimL family protein N-acetyltransferase